MLNGREEQSKIEYRQLLKENDYLKESCEKYQLILEGANDGLWVWDLEKDQYEVSVKDMERYAFNKHKEKSSIEEWKKLLHPQDRKKAQETLDSFLWFGEGIYESIYRLKGRDGKYYWVLSKGVACRNKSGKVIRVAGSHTDITHQIELDDKLYRLAYYDQLTRLANAEKLREIFEVEKEKVNQDKQMALLYIDIDNFSYVNNTMGFRVGNEMIKQTACMLESYFGSEHYVARTSADEFIVLLQGYEKGDELQVQVDKFMEKVATQPFYVKKQPVMLTFSVGVAVFNEHGNTYFDLLQKANTALFCAKRNGKDQCVIYHEEMESYAYNYIDKIQQIRYGIENQEFRVYYQPIVDAEKAILSGVEALVRWYHPYDGPISPGQFIPEAEQSGQIVQIEKWVVEEVFQQCQKWTDRKEMPTYVSINLSAKGLIEKNINQFLENLLSKYPINPGSIEFEITETALLDQIDQTLKTLHDLKKQGFRLALDDFGTGYSSLNYLNRLPIDRIKLDKCFINTVEEQEKDRLMVEAIIQLSHKMGLKVVAEGVETESQQQALKNLKCDFMQGYYYGKPQPFNNWEAYLIQRSLCLQSVLDGH
ncbi:PAS domain S-box-containing protein/diguanylate cyclase (GGDEF) domain-containing protein [Tindallia magadiensis]|uniref:PAS domain S-box-containing protein/diguanylate cyclase (GGDEF) domain-containing protein n=1 Tax=Tindallia magadiensis TaxID=69895 RepID=A0A1I3DWI1_9FIRM|nr:GGDEF and EAL domain-containing protein [Tindallia magadiensis]SFH90821.1 PAS domain S-box-containing protein/diguanylate cyclase (GGDEF) domain-containing protein [Tindallia magadiensis]